MIEIALGIVLGGVALVFVLNHWAAVMKTAAVLAVLGVVAFVGLGIYAHNTAESTYIGYSQTTSQGWQDVPEPVVAPTPAEPRDPHSEYLEWWDTQDRFWAWWDTQDSEIQAKVYRKVLSKTRALSQEQALLYARLVPTEYWSATPLLLARVIEWGQDPEEFQRRNPVED